MAKGQKKQKKTIEVIDKLKHVFAMDGTIKEACYYAEISEATYYSWIKNDKELLESFNRLKNKPVLTARTAVVNGLKDSPEFSLKYLERKKKDEFGAGPTVAVQINNQTNIDKLELGSDIKEAVEVFEEKMRKYLTEKPEIIEIEEVKKEK